MGDSPGSASVGRVLVWPRVPEASLCASRMPPPARISLEPRSNAAIHPESFVGRAVHLPRGPRSGRNVSARGSLPLDDLDPAPSRSQERGRGGDRESLGCRRCRRGFVDEHAEEAREGEAQQAVVARRGARGRGPAASGGAAAGAGAGGHPGPGAADARAIVQQPAAPALRGRRGREARQQHKVGRAPAFLPLGGPPPRGRRRPAPGRGPARTGGRRADAVELILREPP